MTSSISAKIIHLSSTLVSSSLFHQSPPFVDSYLPAREFFRRLAASSAMSKSCTMDIELGYPNANCTSAHGPDHYFQEVNEFQMFLDSTANVVHRLKEANQEFRSATGSAALKEIQGRMEEDIDEVWKMAQIMKEKLQKMIINNVENRKNPGSEKGTAIDMSRMSLIIELKTRIKERKSDFKNLGETVRQEYLNVIQRMVFTVTGLEISDLSVGNGNGPSICMMQMATIKLLDEMVAAVDEIKERHVAAIDFDKKILEVQKNFEQMAVLVEARH